MLNAQTTLFAARLGKLLDQLNLSISCAESCTGGGLAYAITSVAGSSGWFKQSYVTYCNEAKTQMLNVPAQTLKEDGAVSKATVECMVKGCAQAASADVAVSISGIAGPGGGSTEKPVGLVWFGFFVNGNIVTQHVIFDGDRSSIRSQAIDFALDKIIEKIENSN